MKAIKLTEKEMIEVLNQNKEFVGFVFENQKCFSGFDFDMNTGFDLKANENVYLKKGEVKVIKTGVKWVAPKGYFLFIVPRSGLSLKTPLVISNSPGTIEATYRGDIGIILKIDDTLFESFDNYKTIKKQNDLTLFIEKETRLAQAIILKTAFTSYQFPYIYYTISKDLYKNWEIICESKRGASGFGSTGLK